MEAYIGQFLKRVWTKVNNKKWQINRKEMIKTKTVIFQIIKWV